MIERCFATVALQKEREAPRGAGDVLGDVRQRPLLRGDPSLPHDSVCATIFREPGKRRAWAHSSMSAWSLAQASEADLSRGQEGGSGRAPSSGVLPYRVRETPALPPRR